MTELYAAELNSEIIVENNIAPNPQSLIVVPESVEPDSVEPEVVSPEIIVPEATSETIYIDDKTKAELFEIDESSNYEWVDKSRRYIGQKVQRATGSLDDYLSRDYVPSINESYARLRMGSVLEEGGRSFNNSGVKLKIDLPKSKDKWSLIFETDPDEFESLENQSSGKSNQKQALKSQDGSIGALKFMLDKHGDWKTDFDVGVRTPLPLNSFIRFNMKRRYKVSENWGARLKHSIYAFHHEGSGEQTQFFLERTINPDWFFRNTVNIKWQDVGSEVTYSEAVSFINTPNDRNVWVYSAGTYYMENPRPHLQAYSLSASFRRCVLLDWLFIDASPSVTWSDPNFEAFTALTFGIEMFFTD